MIIFLLKFYDDNNDDDVLLDTSLTPWLISTLSTFVNVMRDGFSTVLLFIKSIEYVKILLWHPRLPPLRTSTPKLILIGEKYIIDEKFWVY